MKKIAIIGVGLIGGSLGKALRGRAGAAYRITGIGRDKRKLAEARASGAIDAYTTDCAEGVRDADIVVIGTPVDIIARTVREILAHLKPGTIITDVGSVKGAVIREVGKILARSPALRRPVFIGGHPMAGSEKTGVRHSSAHLYDGATVVLTPGPDVPEKALGTVRTMWRKAGAGILVMSAQEHDRAVASTSHLPHVLAFCVCLTAAGLQKRHPAVSRIVAGSFRDVTRVAASNPRDWAAICSANRKELGKAIDAFIRQLEAVKNNLPDTDGMGKVFSAAKSARQRILDI